MTITLGAWRINVSDAVDKKYWNNVTITQAEFLPGHRIKHQRKKVKQRKPVLWKFCHAQLYKLLCVFENGFLLKSKRGQWLTLVPKRASCRKKITYSQPSTTAHWHHHGSFFWLCMLKPSPAMWCTVYIIQFAIRMPTWHTQYIKK